MNTSTSEQELVVLSGRQRQIPLLQEVASQSSLHVFHEEVGSGKLGPQRTMGSGVRRGPSYSDSFFFLPALAAQSPSGATSGFFLQDVPLQPLIAAARQDASTQTETPPNKTRPAAIFKKVGSFLFHIFLISIFENVFFFTFISKSEDKGILKTVGNYIDDVAENCAVWPKNETEFWNNILTFLVSPANVSAVAEVSLSERDSANNTLLLQSWLYTAGILVTVFGGAVFGWRHGWLSRRTVKRILLENIGLVAMLGLYEFIFFRTIIYEYTSLSVPEIDEFAVSTLQDTCGLFMPNSTLLDK
jgi:hypothetical protein